MAVRRSPGTLATRKKLVNPEFGETGIVALPTLSVIPIGSPRKRLIPRRSHLFIVSEHPLPETEQNYPFKLQRISRITHFQRDLIRRHLKESGHFTPVRERNLTT